jgi:lipopolysaccharide/colanic/teichoic acid biosynthesis glycosyltransferase
MTRAVDVVASVAGLLVLSPLFALLALLVKLTSRGPVFYRARRVGRGGEVFHLYKFRSMVVREGGAAITTAGDDRITLAGRFLRKTKVDELPQLINVVKGDMSLVGPRPEDPKYVAMYDDDQRRILDVRPGMTSPASLLYRSEEEQLIGDDWETMYIERVMPEKIRIDLEYFGRRTLFSDVALIARTVGALLR